MATKSALPRKMALKMTPADALGKLKVLAVGVSDYQCDFSPLKQCKTDAQRVADACRDVVQLNADPDHIVCMTDASSTNMPTRGLILSRLQSLANTAEENDRILFYFSGHGVRLSDSDDHYLVPSDVYSATSPDALISIKQVYEILSASRAKQKIVILDACLSGATVNGPKSAALNFSETFFKKHLWDTTGFAVLSSSTSSQESYTKSDDPKLSLFTFYLIKGLWGEVDALDNKILTVPKLFDYVNTSVRRKAKTYNKSQTPTLYSSGTGVLVLGDFRKQIISGEKIDLPSEKISQVILSETFPENVRSILTNLRRTGFTQDQLQHAANTPSALAAYLEDEFSGWRTKLRETFSFAPSTIESEGGDLIFPDGSLCHEYMAESKDRGKVVRKLHLYPDWFLDGSRLKLLIDIFNINIEKMVLELNIKISPIEQLQGLIANGWEIKSENDGKVVANKNGVKLAIYQKKISISGIDFDEVFNSSELNSADRKILSETVRAIALT